MPLHKFVQMLKQWFFSLLIILLTTINHWKILGVEGSAYQNSIVCEKQGLQVFPESSSKYAFCMKFPTSQIWYYYVFDCPSGTLFNQEVMACTKRGVNPCDDLYKSINTKHRFTKGGAVVVRDGSDNDHDPTEVVCP